MATGLRGWAACIASMCILMLSVRCSSHVVGSDAAESMMGNHDGSTFLAETTTSLQDTLSPRGTTFYVDDSFVTLSFDPFEEMLTGIDTMQSRFFEVWLGQWPEAIDWTAAVTNSYLSTTMSSMLRATHSSTLDSISSTLDSIRSDKSSLDNMINKYFSQSISYYFAEDAFDIRNEAYDDMLWVVLGWLESIKFIKSHAKLAHQSSGSSSSSSWYGHQFAPAFAHRAHIFYHIAQSGWDETLCGGGLTWNPSLQPYKNTITNMLFISASAEMYLHHPGDDNGSPFSHDPRYASLPSARPHDPRWLDAAVKGYEWLKSVNMTNSLGLYVDGYHISEWWRGNTQCDQRDESVYTYNQGVILSGLRGLWESTGNVTYLEDAHTLVRNVISATGWSLMDQDVLGIEQDQWHGLGRNGILTEICDPHGDCSQDSQTFKGIFFKHLTDLCSALPPNEDGAEIPGNAYIADGDLSTMHERSCTSYVKWLERNAVAAMATKDEDGVFGMSWDVSESDDLWQMQNGPPSPSPLSSAEQIYQKDHASSCNYHRTSPRRWSRDPNDRGRGRTVETQGGGLMVVRALWELLQQHGDKM